MQGFDSTGKILNNITEFPELLKTAKEIFNKICDGLYPHKNLSSLVPFTKNPRHTAKGQTRPQSLGRGCKKSKTKSNNKPSGPLNVPGNGMN